MTFKTIQALICTALCTMSFLSSNALGKDLGIVLLPDLKCKKMVERLTKTIKNKLPQNHLLDTVELNFHPHCTLIHLANPTEDNRKELLKTFNEFHKKYRNTCIQLPIKDIKATGGNNTEGFKWLDIQFESSNKLLELRNEAISKFSPYHKSMLQRMNDDFQTLTPEQKQEVKKYGVYITPYVPHITAWYINLPKERKSIELYDIANSLKKDFKYKKCYAEYMAIVELGRNGNALNIIMQKPLCK